MTYTGPMEPPDEHGVDVQQYWLGEIEADFDVPGTDTYAEWEHEVTEHPVIGQLFDRYVSECCGGKRADAWLATRHLWSSLFLTTQPLGYLEDWKITKSYENAGE